MNRLHRSERLLAWLLCFPAVSAMLLVTAYPILYAFWLSLFRYDLRFPGKRQFIGLDNYLAVLTSEIWWQSLINTLMITGGSVIFELLFGFVLAMLMHKAVIGRRTIRTAVLVPYAMVTVIAALAWKFAFDPVTGFINGLTGMERAWFSERWSAYFVIIFTEIWKTTPFMALLLLSGLTLIPNDLLRAANVDGATAWQRFRHIILPLMQPTILVALLFRTLDAFRIFDTVYVQTRGALETETVSIIGYHTLIVRLNLGLGSAVSMLIFGCVVLIAIGFIKGFGLTFEQEKGGAP